MNCICKVKFIRAPYVFARFLHSRRLNNICKRMSAKRRGIFIVFEGCDRSGKSTQSRLLVEWLKNKGIATEHTNFPDRTTPIGTIINSYLTNAQELSDHVIHLMFSANRWEREKSIRNELLSGTTIVCDRYAYSGVSYSVAKGLDFDWCCAPDRGLLKPDAVFYLRAKPDQLKGRGGYGEERYEKIEMQLKVSEVFDKFCAQESSYWHECNATTSQEELHAQITAIAEKLLETKSNQPLDKLTWERKGI